VPHYAEDGDAARRIILEIIPPKAVVGFGDSSSVRQIGVAKQLEKRGNPTINPFKPIGEITDYKAFSRDVFQSSIAAALCNVFITGTNAISEDGRLVNIDGVGNRVAGMIWGHAKVILVIGRNKIVKDLDAAMERLKKVTAPEHVSRRGSSNSPCTVKGECRDCSGNSRVCNVTTIIEGAPLFSEMNVILVDEDLGLGWDKSWESDRIEAISDRHDRHMWGMPEEAIKALTKDELWASVRDLLYDPNNRKDD
jgi:L-lactate utilization protein LutB